MSNYKHIVLISGDDSFSIHELLDKWKSTFIAKHGDFNFDSLEGKKLKAETLIEESEQVPFLGEKRMLYVHNFLKNGSKEDQKKMASSFNKIPESTLLVFVEEKTPDKRLGLYKKLNKEARTETFESKTGGELALWIQKKFKEEGKPVSSDISSHLADRAGNNLWKLSNEISKIVLYCDERDVTKEDIDLHAQSSIQTTVFKFVDTIGKRDQKTGLKLLQGLSDSGEELMFIFHMIVRQIRILTITKDLLSRGDNQFSISKKIKVPPFAAKNAMSQSKNFENDKLCKLYDMLSKIEIGLKTGGIKITKDNQKDFMLALEKFILEACK